MGVLVAAHGDGGVRGAKGNKWWWWVAGESLKIEQKHMLAAGRTRHDQLESGIGVGFLGPFRLNKNET